jgi:hypothetical protein
MAKTKETFDWIMPLVLMLFLVFSWLFSFLGSKIKKRQSGEARSPAQGKEDTFLEKVFGKTQELPNEQPPVQQGPYNLSRDPPGRDRMKQPIAGEPAITAKPIKPKWWGA